MFKMRNKMVYWVSTLFVLIYLIPSIAGDGPMKKSKVIIIGAGAAGIAAATKLVSNGVEDFVVLEAENRIGGRVHTVPFEGNTSIDMGAQWIHGQKGNPIYEMAKEFNMVEDECPEFFKSLSFNSSGKPIHRESSLQLFQMVDDIMDDKEGLAKHNGSLGEFVRDRLKTDLVNHTTLSHLLATPLFEEVLEFFGKFENSIDGSDSWFETSARGSIDYVKLDGCVTTIWKTGGYSNALKLLMKQMPGQTPIDLSKQIIFNKEVEKISWEDPNTITIKCADGSEYSTERVLTTVSLGVLKAKSELFVPPLPSWKTNAIQGLFIGTVDKIFVKFSHKWWEDGYIGFNLFWTKEDEKTLFKEIGGVNGKPWVVDAFGFYLTTQDPLTFLGWVTGPSARYMETLTDEQVEIDTMKLLRHFLGANYTIPDPVRVVRSTWGTNKHFKGSYSCRSLTTEKMNTSAKDLGAPVENSAGKPVLLFAGEATHPRFYSTVHGAVESGWREADRVLQSEAHTRYSACIHKDVVILGGGMAGIGAAMKLTENNVTNFVVLEAQSQAGGRIKSVDIGNGEFLEEGAQWIHGQNNPVYKEAHRHQLTMDVRSDEAQGRYLRDDGVEIPLKLVHQVAGAVGNMLEDCEQFYSSEDKNYPTSIGHYLDEQFESYVKTQPPDQDVHMMRQLFDWHRRFQIIDNSCSSLYNLSAKAWGQYEFCGGDDYINLSEGFSSVVESMVKQLPPGTLRVQCPVKQILWDNFINSHDVVLFKGNGGNHVEDNEDSSQLVISNGVKYHSSSVGTNSLRDVCYTSTKDEEKSEDATLREDVKHKSICENGEFNHHISDTDTTVSQAESISKIKIEEKTENGAIAEGKEDMDEIIVKCVDGTMYRTKHVLVTASLGYLKENLMHMFVPHLPLHWSQAISSIGFASITKIFLVYDQPWWTDKDQGFQFIWSDLGISGPGFEPWLRELTGFDVLTNLPNVLLGWVGGASAEEVEGMKETEIGDQCTRLLRHFLGSDVTVPLPRKVVRSSWSNNNYIRGAYSHTTTACDKLGIKTHDLTIPVKTKQGSGIYFAGEALHEKYFSTTHGAFLSGSEQAEKILNHLKT